MQARYAGFVAGLCLLVLTAPAGAADGPKVTGDYQYVPGRDRTMLLLQGDVLVRLAADGVTETERHRLGARYTHLAERDDYFVAVSASPRAVVVLNKATLKPVRDRALPYRGVTDLALHPKLPVAYVAVEADVTAPSYRVVVFDEATAEAREPRGFFGTWVRVHPAGTFLVTGHRDIYEKGTQFFINPGWRLHAVPEYGSIDLLISYALDDRGLPAFMDLKTKAGGNGAGLRMSADGARVTYLSHVGYPEFTGNLGGFDPLDLQKLPATYATKDRATALDLAYHPYLPLCASPGKDTVAFFHRETGKVEERLAGAARFDRAHRVYFAPDGRHVVLDCERGGVRALRNVALKLSPQEVATVARPADPGAVDNAADVKAAMLRARREIEQKLDPGKVARDKAVDWLKLNNRFGPDHKIVADQTAVIDQELDAGRNVHLTIGKGLVKAGAPVFLCIRSGAFFALPLTPQQAQAFDFPEFSVVKRPGGKAGWRLMEPRAQLHDLRVDGANGVDGAKPLTGTVKLRRLDAETGHYALKVAYSVGDTWVTGYHHLGEYLTKTEGEVRFSFAPVLADKRAHKGPLPVFVELVTFATADRQSEPAIASNTLGQVVTVKAP